MSTLETSRINAFSSASEMLTSLREGRLSAVDLLDIHIRRIERYDTKINAVVTRDFANARKAAEEADKARRNGEEKPLLGLPITIKDCIYTKGLPTTGGLQERAGAIAERDCILVARLREAGAVIMGKTNVPPWAADWQASNPLFGQTNNPWDPTLTPGGSTGGGAAALAAGLTPLEFGGDLAGSIRIPAAFCGVYGHRPSTTVMPRSCHFPGSMRPHPTVVLASVGPLARSAEDLEFAMKVTAGPEADEEVGWKLELPPSRHDRLEEYRVAMMPPIPWLPVDGEILSGMERVAAQLHRVGAKVDQTQPEKLEDMRRYYSLFRTILTSITFIGVPSPVRSQTAEGWKKSGNEFLTASAQGLEGSASDYVLWHEVREEYRESFQEFFREWDVMISPANFVNAFPHTNLPAPERTLDVNGQRVSYYLQAVYPSLSSLSGHPATAFPVGQTKSGLPVGLQAIGPHLEDYTTIRFASLLGQELGGFLAPPGYEE